MLYIRNIFQQDLRKGKQIAFPKKVSNDFFQFDYSLPDEDRKISFSFSEKIEKSDSFKYNKTVINTRLYAAKSESRIDGELKHFLINKLKVSVDDILIFKQLSKVAFQFELVKKSSDSYTTVKNLLHGQNHELVTFSDSDTQPESNILHFDAESLKVRFADWLISLDGLKHNYYSTIFNSSKDSLLESLSKYEVIFTDQFGYNLFEIPIENSDQIINQIENDLYLDQGRFYDLSLKTSNHMPRALLGKKNYLHFLRDSFARINYSVNVFKICPQIDFSFKAFSSLCEKSGLHYENEFITRFIGSLLTKPFVILTGLSGSGKTKLAQAFVQWICQEESQYRIIPVGADWTNREPLLGYPNALKPEEYVKPDSGVLDLIIQANHNPDLPHFLVLDEMNLSHVERYFADFLSVMESKEEIPLHSEGAVQNGVPARLKVPSNLFIIGTVNIDETTNMFSPKVLDRANTIEFRVTQEEMKNFLGDIKDINMDSLTGKGAEMANSFLKMARSKEISNDAIAKISPVLVQFFGELKKTGAEFGYRSAHEILSLINNLSVLDSTLNLNKKIDISIVQKLLPKLHGSRRKLCPVLETLGSLCITGDIKIIKDVFDKSDFDFKSSNVLYPLSLEKIARMNRSAIDNGFASFAEA